MAAYRRRLKPWVPWVIKYRPRRIDDVINQDEAKKIVIPWLRQWLQGKPPAKKALLLYGPPGVGKTSLVEAAANELGFEILELNASDYRSAEAIKRTVGAAARRRPLFGKGLIILLDEIDGIAPKEDSGGLKALVEILTDKKNPVVNPIIMTANDPWKDQLKPLRDLAEMVRFKPLSMTQIVALLQKICDLEGLECEREALRYIAEVNQGDVRACINDLQAVAEGYGKVTIGIVRAVVRGRDKKIDVFKTLNTILYSDPAWRVKKAVSSSEVDYETLIAWLNDNAPKKYEDPEDLYRAMEALSRATLFLSRAKFGGHWSLLSYVFDLIGPGVRYARKNKPPSKARYGYPDRIKLLAKAREAREIRESIAAKIASHIHASRKTVKNEVLPYLSIIFQNEDNPVPAARLALGLKLENREVEFLAKGNAQQVLEAIEKIKRHRGKELPRETQEERATASRGAERRASRGRKKRPAGRSLESFFD